MPFELTVRLAEKQTQIEKKTDRQRDIQMDKEIDRQRDNSDNRPFLPVCHAPPPDQLLW